MAAAHIRINPSDGRRPDRSKRNQKLNTDMRRALLPRSGQNILEKQKRDAGDRANQHGCRDITLRKHVLKNVPGVLAGKVKNAFLIELKKCNAERGRPNRKIVPDLGYMRHVQKDVNGHCSHLPHGPGTNHFPRAFGVRHSR